jgi:hypothetical protein
MKMGLFPIISRPGKPDFSADGFVRFGSVDFQNEKP